MDAIYSQSNVLELFTNNPSFQLQTKDDSSVETQESLVENMIALSHFFGEGDMYNLHDTLCFVDNSLRNFDFPIESLLQTQNILNILFQCLSLPSTPVCERVLRIIITLANSSARDIVLDSICENLSKITHLLHSPSFMYYCMTLISMVVSYRPQLCTDMVIYLHVVHKLVNVNTLPRDPSAISIILNLIYNIMSNIHDSEVMKFKEEEKDEPLYCVPFRLIHSILNNTYMFDPLGHTPTQIAIPPAVKLYCFLLNFWDQETEPFDSFLKDFVVQYDQRTNQSAIDVSILYETIAYFNFRISPNDNFRNTPICRQIIDKFIDLAVSRKYIVSKLRILFFISNCAFHPDLCEYIFRNPKFIYFSRHFEMLPVAEKDNFFVIFYNCAFHSLPEFLSQPISYDIIPASIDSLMVASASSEIQAFYLTAINSIFENFPDYFRDGRIDLEDLGEAANELLESGLMFTEEVAQLINQLLENIEVIVK